MSATASVMQHSWLKKKKEKKISWIIFILWTYLHPNFFIHQRIEFFFSFFIIILLEAFIINKHPYTYKKNLHVINIQNLFISWVGWFSIFFWDLVSLATICKWLNYDEILKKIIYFSVNVLHLSGCSEHL